ncbi:MAG: hypothetical protein K1X47_03915, partial [Cyclobacteriaceae bacterium]|nr:hypothetical protein [Cyclobacteriaceae bacterium]
RVVTGTPGSAHAMTVLANITNNGSIRLFDDTGASPLTDPNYTSGAVYTTAARTSTVVTTFSGTADQTITCNNQTDLYKLIMNKGTGQQAILTVNSSGASNFRLFGPNNIASSGTSPSEISNNNISIINGTLQLTGTLTIPNMITRAGGGDYFPIPQNGALWLNGAGVSVTVTNTSTSNDDERIILDGLLRVTNGTMDFGFSKGLGSLNAGTFQIEGWNCDLLAIQTQAIRNGCFYLHTKRRYFQRRHWRFLGCRWWYACAI